MEKNFLYSNIAVNSGKTTIDDAIWPLLSTGKDILIVTGFTSLEFLISKVDTIDFEGGSILRILVGNEFNVDRLMGHIQDETVRYWQKDSFQHKNINKYKKFYKLILEDKIEIRINDGLHAKIYSNDNYVTAGSSNFSYNGLANQIEVMITRNCSEVTDFELKDFSEWCWSVSVPYSLDFTEILERIMYVEDEDWRHAFYFVYEEFFMGRWYSESNTNASLWATQKQFLSQAIILLEKYGGFINADPTGSGKTIETVAAIKYLHDKYNAMNLLTRDTIKVVVPASVKDAWIEDLDEAGIVSFEVISSSEPDLEGKIKNAKVLVYDEAHTHSNENSKRSKKSLQNNADYKMFITATPITKKIKDYYGLLLLFGVDNLDELTFETMNKFFMSGDAKKHSQDMLEEVKISVSKSLSNVTIRRTKDRLNKIALENGDPVYPNKINHTYEPLLSESDINAIEELRVVSSKLRGLYFSKSYTGASSVTAGLSRHHVAYYLRSSKIALLEHIYGTKEAYEYYGYDSLIIKQNFGEKRKGLPGAIRVLKDRMMSYKSERIRQLYQEEINLYESIGWLTKSISEQYTISKLKWLINDIGMNDSRMYLMFDKSPITCLYYYIYIKENMDINVYFANGSTKENKEQIQRIFNPKSRETGIHVAFTTDVFSEGVNLQRSDCFISSDIPYTPTKQEQRIGRVDRMNSLFENVDIVWIRYPECLMTSNDIVFKKRYNTVKEILGSNYDLPEFFDDYENSVLNDICYFTNEDFIVHEEDEEETVVNENEVVEFVDSFGGYQDLERYAVPGINNKNLLSDGGRIYSFVKSDKNWSLLYLKEKISGHPSLAFVDLDSGIVTHDIQDIVVKLKDRLPRVTGSYKKDIPDDYLNGLIDKIINKAKTRSLSNPTGEQNAALEMLERHLKEYSDFEHEEVYELYQSIENKKGIAKAWHSAIKDTYNKYLREREGGGALPTIKGIANTLDRSGYFEPEYIYDLLCKVDDSTVDHYVRYCMVSISD